MHIAIANAIFRGIDFRGKSKIYCPSSVYDIVHVLNGHFQVYDKHIPIASQPKALII